MQAPHSFIKWFFQSVITTSFEGETAASRAQQVAILITIYGLQCDEEQATIKRIREIYNFPQSHVNRIVKRLIERGLIEKAPIPRSSASGGRMFSFKIKETEEFRKLMDGLK